ncbi:hypothetical protein TELCIR_05141 [Teladorsagia circumcincta]|uniref:Uncharacterized protein n=1 Tax=Teladorsagia circumcincta TaxID=45464 RepID=A0A2G9URM0_TELCI|nr:hypothetical protein TELCIR_05141 [Teladorsagia circumcincta]
MELIEDRKNQKVAANLLAEIKRLNEKLAALASTISRDVADGQGELKNEFSRKFSTMETAFKSQAAKYEQLDLKVARDVANGLKAQEDRMETLNRKLVDELAKQKSKLNETSEALAAFEKNLELGRNKMDTTINAEIQRRKLHEKSLLNKISAVEDRLNSYVGNLRNSIQQIKSGKENVEIPTIDFDGLRREMEAIAADKGKMNMEGLLMLEQRMARAQSELQQDRKKISHELATLESSSDVEKLRNQVKNLSTLNDQMKHTQEVIRDKVDKQIPKDLNDLAAKTDNITQHLTDRLDKEEEERFLAIKELQEAFQKLQINDGAGNGKASSNTVQVRRELDECKVAIKKLAESVTTVKNVLDKKITDESRKREAEFGRLSSSMKG